MNILHIANNDSGGAANAMLCLHNSLLANQIQSKILVLHKCSDYENIIPFLRNRNLFEKIDHSIKYRAFNLNRMYDRNTYKINSDFTYYNGPYDITKHRLYEWADIIHLHWYHNFVNLDKLLKNSSKPCLYTLHDENLFLGGFHYSFDKEIANIKSWKIEKKLYLNKLKLFKSHNHIQYVAPSRWLFDLLHEKNYNPCSYIAYGVKSNLNKLLNKQEQKIKLGIPPTKLTFLLTSTNLNTPRKGVQETIRSFVNNCNGKNTLLIVGKGNNNYNNENIKYLGYVSNQERLCEIYSASDFFINPALADNLPNTVLESLACGTPVIGFDCGGMRDMINNSNGFLYPVGDFECLFKTNYQNFIYEMDRNEIRKNAIKQFSIDTQYDKYMNLYNATFLRSKNRVKKVK